MTSIPSYYSVYASPPPPPLPPPQVIGVDGEPKEVEVVVVIGQRNPADPYRSLLPYGGLSGAQQNSVRDQNFFFGEGLAGRAEAQGGSASASIMVGEEDGDGIYTTLGLSETVYDAQGWGFTQIGGQQGRDIPGQIRFDGRGSALDQEERAALGLPPRTTWDPLDISPDYLLNIGTKKTGSNYNVRQIGGDELDLFNLARDIMIAAGFGSSWSSNSAGWTHRSEGDVSTFDTGQGFKLTKRMGSGTSSTPAIDIVWGAQTIKIHSTEDNQTYRGPK